MGAALQVPDDASARQPEPPASGAAPTLRLPVVGAQSKERSHLAAGPGEAPGLHPQKWFTILERQLCLLSLPVSGQLPWLQTQHLSMAGHACQPAACTMSPLSKGCNVVHQLCRVLPLAQAMRGQTGSAGRGAW